MEESITIESMFDGRSHFGSFRQHLKHRWKWWLIARVFLCIALIAVGGYMQYRFSGHAKMKTVSIALILMGSMALMRPMIWQMWNERKLRKHPAFDTKIRYTFSKEGIQMEGKKGNVVAPWNFFTELVATKTGLLIYQNKKEYIWIPAYDFSEGEMAEAVELWQQFQ